jgi:hypothetical protein
VVSVRRFLVETSNSGENKQKKKTMFRKFKLVPIDGNLEEHHRHDIRQIEKDLRDYNPTTRAMANLYGGVQDALFSKNKKKNNKKGRLLHINGVNANQRLHLAAANRMRMQQLIHGSNEVQAQHKGISSVGVQQEMMEVKEEAEAKQAEPDEKTAAKEEMLMMNEKQAQRSNLAIPSRQRSKFAELVGATSGTIGTNRLGEVVIRGGTLRNTSYSDIMRALYINSKFKIPGLPETVAELKRLGVSTSLFTSRQARQLYSASASAENVFQQQQQQQQQKGSGCARGKALQSILRLY